MRDGIFGHDVHDHLTRRLSEAMQLRAGRLSKLRTARDAQRYCDSVRERFRKGFPMLPSARTPLQPRTTGVVELPQLRIEKVMFQTRPDFWVTANLYLPRDRGPITRRPAVLISSGHDPDAKSIPDHQILAQTLAHAGFVVLAYDPIGQGERFQYLHTDGTRRDTCQEHCIAGNPMWLVGDFLGSWRAWDGMRAIDFLISRPEVDPARIGMHGCSGGGTLTGFVSLLDDRLAMIAPSCFGMPYAVQAQLESPTDNEQNPQGVVGRGLDLADVYIARAPRPALFMVQRHDFFDCNANTALFHEVRRVYELLGAGDQVQLHTGEHPHGVYADDRTAMVKFFCDRAGIEQSRIRPSVRVLPVESLNVTPTGNLVHGPGVRRACEMTADLATKLRTARRAPSRAKLLADVQRVLTLPVREGEPVATALRPIMVKDSPFRIAWRFAIKSEEDIRVTLCHWSRRDIRKEPHYYATPPAPRQVDLFLPHVSSSADVAAGLVPGGVKWLYTLDVRGLGESRSTTCDLQEDFFNFCDSDFFNTANHFLLGECYLGRRVHDVLVALDLLRSLGTQTVHLHGRGLGSIVATFAALLHPLVNRVTLRHALRSFEELTQVPVSEWPASVLPFGVLRFFDLPDCRRALRAKRVRLIEPWDAFMQPSAIQPSARKRSR